MTEQRIINIVSKVCEKYSHLPYDMAKDLIINDISSIIRGLYRTENFLSSFAIDFDIKVIVCHNPKEDLPFISFLPYLYPQLQHKKQNEELYTVYSIIRPKVLCLQGIVSFIDTREKTNIDEIGFDVATYTPKYLGKYYPNTNKFKRREV